MVDPIDAVKQLVEEVKQAGEDVKQAVAKFEEKMVDLKNLLERIPPVIGDLASLTQDLQALCAAGGKLTGN